MARKKREMKDSNKERQSNIYESTHSSHRQERERVRGAVKVFDRCNGVRLRSSGCVADSLEQREWVWYDNAPRASSVRHMRVLSLGRSVQMVGLAANKGNKAGWEKGWRDPWCNTNDKPNDNTFSLEQQGQLVLPSSKKITEICLVDYRLNSSLILEWIAIHRTALKVRRNQLCFVYRRNDWKGKKCQSFEVLYFVYVIAFLYGMYV